MTQRWLLDTNIVSHIMQGRDQALLLKLSSCAVGRVFISSITLGELEYGIARKGSPSRLRQALDQVLLHMDVLAWDSQAAICYGALTSSLEAKGIVLGNFDMLIAAHAQSANSILVSRDKAFKKLNPTIKIEHW
jgi:tRNA(fMet)-specific endonuclease VapC